MARRKDEHTTIGSLIAERRERAGLSQRQLAAKTGLHHSFIARVESNETTTATPQHLQRLADVLDIDVTELLRLVGVEPNLPEPRAYFRRKLGVNAKEAEVLARLVEDYQAQQQIDGKGERHEEGND